MNEKEKLKTRAPNTGCCNLFLGKKNLMFIEVLQKDVMICGNWKLNVQTRYFIDEVKDKNGKDIDVSSWKQEFVEDLPEQENWCVIPESFY